MDRGNSRLFFVLLLAIIISLSFISASWFSNFFKTGNVIDSSEALIEEDFISQWGNLTFISSSVLERNCELMEGETGVDAGTCDTYRAIYNISEGGSAMVEVLVEMRDDDIIDKEATAQAISDNVVANEGMILDIDRDPTNNTQAVYILSKYSGEIRNLFVLWVSGNNVIGFAISNWNTSLIDDDIFNLPLQRYLEKYPSDLIYPEDGEPNLCNDSDGGINYEVKGITSAKSYRGLDHGVITSETAIDFEDFCCTNCLRGPNLTGPNLVERWCQDDIAYITQYSCPNGCSDGACIPNLCQDSDNGLNYFERGRIYGICNDCSPPVEGGNLDACVDSNNQIVGSGMKLMEFYCINNDSWERKVVDCPGGCQNGVCLPRKPVVDYGNSKGYAIDYETNLFWQRTSVSDKTWSDARNYCEALNLGGYIDWRLPTLKELKVLYPAGVALFPVEQFLEIKSGRNYWSSNKSYAPGTLTHLVGEIMDYAYTIKWNGSFPGEEILLLTKNNEVICVRDGRITPEQAVGVGSCQLCREFNTTIFTLGNFIGRLFGLTNSYTSGWDCVGFDDTPLLTDFNSDINAGDSFSLRVGCGDTALIDSCSLARRYADNNGRNTVSWKSVYFNGIRLATDFVGDVNADDDFDISINCDDETIRNKCQLCRRYADYNGRAAAEWECVYFNGTPLLTDFVGDVNADDDFDFKVSCDIEEVPSCIDDDGGINAYVGGVCIDAEGHLNTDVVNISTWVLTEFNCDENFDCVSTQIPCPYGFFEGTKGDYCTPREEKNDAYFVYTQQGDFDKTLNDIIGENHELSSVDFKNTRFKIVVDERRLSAITSNSGYTDAMISKNYNIDNFAEINLIQRDNYESYSSPDRVPETVFEGKILNLTSLENENVWDLSDETDTNVYLFGDASVDQYHGPGVIHSSRMEDSINIQKTPEFDIGFWKDDLVDYTYANGAYIYVDFLGKMHFRYKTQNQNSRAVFSVGVLACECSLGDERCDGSDYLSCDDGCSFVNNGEVVGECGVIQQCEDSDDGGINPYIVGDTWGCDDVECSIGYMEHEEYCVALSGSPEPLESCTGDNCGVYEFSCINNLVDGNILPCDLGCSNGACIECIDSDGGKDYSTAGDVQGRDVSGELFTNASDRCIGDTLVERICTNGFADSTFFDCPNGCKNGFCEGIECRVEFEDSTAECGTSAYNVDGTLFCTIANGSKYEFELYNVSECELGCSAGVCEVPTCIDYDLGDYENVTKSNATSSLGVVLEDVCSNTNTLQEAVCVGGGVSKDYRTCEFGCSDGRCLGESSCNDSDLGLNYFVKGISVSCVGEDCVIGENESCVDGNNLWESYCGRNDEIVWQQYLCPEGCADGACNIPEDRPNATCLPISIGGPYINPGIRLVVVGSLSYCDPFTLNYLPVKAAGDTCINDYECENNVCVEGECYSVRTELASQRAILEEQTSLLQEIRCWLRSFIGVQDYDECLSESIGG